jgi:hypothetical protein
VKPVLAFLLVSAGIVPCPCGSGRAWALGFAAGATLFILLARAVPRCGVWPLASPAAWAILLRAGADEVLWRGSLASSIMPPALLPYAVIASIVGFALTHIRRQGLRGVATHLATGSVFVAAMLSSGLAGAVAAHLTYNLLALMARAAAQRAGTEGVGHGT